MTPSFSPNLAPSPPQVGANVGWSTLGGGLPPQYTYAQLEAYYAGRQPLSFLSPAVQSATAGRLRNLVVNWPRLVIDSLEERLDVEGFRLVNDAPDRDLWNIWQANRLDVGSQLTHMETLLHGRSYVLVWADETNLEIPRITVESSALMSVIYDPTGTQIVAAVKQWVEGEAAFRTIYLPDRVERYIGPTSLLAQGAVGTLDVLNTAQAWELRSEPIGHDLGQVPVVPFVNRPSLYQPFGVSEIADIIPLADAVNKLATDMMVSSEYHAMPRRYATGIDLGTGQGDQAERVREQVRQQWSQAEKDRVWLSSNAQTQFGQFQEASLANYETAINLLTSHVAALSGLPPQYLGINPQGNPASADAIRSAEATLVKRAQRKMRVLGESWEDVMRLAIIVRDGKPMDGADRMETIWRDPNTPTIGQKVDAAIKLSPLLPRRQTLEDLDYTPTQIDRINSMGAEDAIKTAKQLLTAVDEMVKTYGVSRAAALALLGQDAAALAQAKVENALPALASEVTDPALGGPAPQVPPAA